MIRRRDTLALLGTLLLGGVGRARANLRDGNGPERVVLIAGATSRVSDLDSIELRKLYYGYTVLFEGQPVRALRNRSDPRLDRIFLQTVVAASEYAYESRMLANALQGLRRAQEFTSTAELVKVIAADTLAVGFAWDREVSSDPRVRILKDLWRG